MTDKSLQTVYLASEGVECIPEIISTSIKILIKDGNTKTIALDVETNFTIKKIKHLINDKKNIPIEQQRIIFKGKELQNELDLSCYDIKNDSVLHLVNYKPIIDEEKEAATMDMNPLAKILKDHGLYDALYSNLNDNHIDLETLQNDLPENEINAFCDEFKLNTTHKVKFRKLMRNIYKRKNPDSNMVVILVGDSGVGKTCLTRKYAKNTYVVDSNTSTIGVDYKHVIETLGNNSTMKITIWDTAGQERFHSVCRTYYRRADCIMICYDASDENSFENCENWRQDIESHANNKVVLVLVGCKSDKLKSKDMQLNVSKAQSIIEQPEWEKFNTIHYECSAKSGNNVRNVFLAAAELVLMNRPKTEEKHDVIHGLQKERVKKEIKKCCD